jgi:hypothetical protein
MPWLCVALAGFVLVCVGAGIEAYRHEHGADAGAIISWSNPGVVVALAGLGMVGAGLLVATSALAFSDAPPTHIAMRRGIGLLVAWTVVTAAAVGALIYVATSGIELGHEGHGAAQPTQTTSGNGVPPGEIPGSGQRATLSGTLTLDGAPLEAEFLGVRVTRDGLSTACQYTIPAITRGRYEIKVVADAEVRGCGAPGAEILLWTYASGVFIFSQQTTPWPGNGATATFGATFSSDAPEGASKPVTEFKGELFDRDGARLPGGTVIEAYVDDVRCGITSLRYGDDFENLYTLIVAGPESVPGCASDATLTFRLDGAAAAETAVNDLGRNEDGHELILTLE